MKETNPTKGSMSIPMISLVAHLYAGKRLKAGDKFECRGQSDARLMRALGRAIDYTPPPPIEYKPPVKTARKYFTAAVVDDGEYVFPAPAVSAPSAEALADAPDFVDGGATAEAAAKPKRAYRRRDMKADE
jgi:hypothetical protein